MTVIESLLAEAFGVPADDPKVKGVINALDRVGALNHWAVVKLQILKDPCRDHRVIMRRYGVSRGFVYKVWNG